MSGNTLGNTCRHDSRNLLNAGGPQLCDAAKAAKELLCRTRTHAGNIFKACLNCALGPALAMESYRESVRFITNLLN